MLHSRSSERRAQPIAKPITRVLVLLLVFTNVMLGVLLYFQYERQLSSAWTDRYKVPLDNLVKEIEYGMQLGVPLRTMENLPQLLGKTTARYPELSSLFVVGPEGNLIAHSAGVAKYPRLARMVKGIRNGAVSGKAVNDGSGGHFLVWSVTNPFGAREGFVLIKLPWAKLEGILSHGRERLILGIAAILAGFIALAILLFRLICRDLESGLESLDHCADKLISDRRCPDGDCARRGTCALSELAARMDQVGVQGNQSGAPAPAVARDFFGHSRFRARIFVGAMLLLLGSCVASTAVGYFMFRDTYLPVLYSQSRIIGESIGELVTEMHGHGIPVAKMTGMNQIFSGVISAFPEIAALGLYDAAGKRLQATGRPGAKLPPPVTAPQGLDDPSALTIPIETAKSLIAMVRIDKVPHFFADRLLDIALDVLALLVVSMLIASELLSFIVRFLVVVPLEGLEREIRGLRSYTQALPSMLTSSIIHRVTVKARNLLQQAPSLTAPAEHSGGSPLLSYVRPPLFLVVFADALSLSFFPMYVESLPRHLLSWISPNLVMALPISIFMLVWAASLPMAGQWSDHVGRRRSFLTGALVTAVGLALTALSQNVLELILVRSLTAVGFGIVYITAQSYVADHTTARDRTKGMATFLGGFFSGSLSGAAMGGILADRLGYQATFWISAVIALMAAAFVYYFIEQAESAPSRPAAPAAPPVPPLRLQDFAQLLKDRCFLLVVILTAIPAKILLTGFLYYSAPLYLKAAGATQSATGRAIMLYGITIVLLCPLAARMADKWDLRRKFIGSGSMVSALALCIPFVAPGVGGLLVAILLVAVAHAFAVPPQLAVITEHIQTLPNPPSIGKVMGIFRLSERAGNILGPLLFGVLFTFARPQTGFLMAGIYMVLSSLLFMVFMGQWKFRRAAA